ncbi:hypothetical protein RchiOBHm_Chr7g0211311 [Rosa chinensis]|uniref:Uncharacterized protein n=1 Tax=Rosa chinensis TaxID=74649 RepID=A0A2P6PAF2_ROSCH|nr:hypothetical protein RchiOBHm_Chr7g0211311 [Rosa chinensis]
MMKATQHLNISQKIDDLEDKISKKNLSNSHPSNFTTTAATTQPSSDSDQTNCLNPYRKPTATSSHYPADRHGLIRASSYLP